MPRLGQILLYVLIRIPVGVLAIITLFLLALVVLGGVVTIASWTLPGIQGTVVGVAVALLIALPVVWFRGRRNKGFQGQGRGWLRPDALWTGLLVAGLALFGHLLFPVRRLAAEALGFTGPLAVPLLLHAIQSGDEQVDGNAWRALARLGPAAAPAADYIFEQTNAEEGGVGGGVLSKIGAPAVPGLLAALKDPKLKRRQWASRVLKDISVPPEGAVQLAEALTSPDWGIAPNAEETLRRMGPKAAPAIPSLIRLLASEDRQQVESAVRVLQAIGPAAVEAVPALIRLLRRGDVSQYEVAKALGAIGAAAVSPLREVLRSPDARPEWEGALRALHEMGVEAGAALPEVRPLLHSKDVGLRLDAALAWSSIGGDSSSSLPILLAALRTKEVSSAALLRLTDLGPLAAPALPDYIRLLHEPNEWLRARAAELIAVLGAAGAPAVGELTEVLRHDPSPEVRAKAIKALRRIGPSAAVAVPAIRNALDGLPEEDRLNAALAVCELDR
ncbi:MAG TPA: HEAT repeat domain-containing protein, partial [Gemmataceae bacterium]